jgi:hypothetical protein
MAHTEQEIKEANAKISELLKQVDVKFEEIAKIAEEFGLFVYWDGPSYGMGGSYTPKSEAYEYKPEYAEDDWEPSDEDYGWRSSSSSC